MQKFKLKKEIGSVYSEAETAGAGFTISLFAWAASKVREPVALALLYILSIFLLSSWAREKVISTITNNTTTKLRSDKILFI